MKKKYFYITIPILIIIISIITTKNFKKKEIIDDIPFIKTFSFYKEENYERYLTYQKEKNISDKQTILEVNMNLDKPFYSNITNAPYLYQKTILVNKYHYLNNNYVPKNLITTTENATKEIQIDKETYEAFQEMAKNAQKDNFNIKIVSAYRSYQYQNNLYSNYLKKDTQENVDKYSARPGHSEHQTGLAIDINNGIINYNKFHLTQEFTWMQKNAHIYGFILRYPLDKEYITGYQYEPWHYRYVGKDIATYIHDNNLTYEEYFYEFLDKKT